MKNLTLVRARDWKGQSFEEILTPRVLICGPNGSGKTARLEAIRYALRPPTAKTGLAPFMANDFCEIAVAADEQMVVRSCTRKVKGDAVSFKMQHRFEPSMGETTKAKVDARVEKSLQLEPFVLDMAAWFSGSAPDRRRSLLALLKDSAGDDVDGVVARLNVELESNSEWAPIFAAAMNGAPDGVPPLEWLQQVEQMAKARRAQIEERRKAVTALLRTEDDDQDDGDVPRSADEVESLLETVNGEVESLEADRARSEGHAREKKSIQKRIDGIRGVLPKAVLQDENRSARLEAIVGKARATLAEAKKAHSDARLAREGAEDKHRKATDLHTRKSGAYDAAEARLKIIDGLRAKWEPGKPCPFCGTDSDKLDESVATMLAHLSGEVDSAALDAGEALAANTKAARAAFDAATAVREAQDAAQAATGSLRTLEAAVAALADLAAAEAELAALGEMANEETSDRLAAARIRRDDLTSELRRGAAHRQRVESTRKAQDEASGLEAAAKAIRDVAEAVGAKGEQARILRNMIGPLCDALGKFECGGRTYALRLEDDRGDPDAMLTLGGVAYPAMSGGEQAIGLASLATAVAACCPDRTACVLVEAGEIDEGNLVRLCDALERLDAANVVVATHLPCPEDLAVESGWDVLELG